MYKAFPLSPVVTTWILALVPSEIGRPAGKATVGKHKVPLPVSFKNGFVREMLKARESVPIPRLMKTYDQG